MIWRNSRGEIVARDGDDYVVIDATGAILHRYRAYGMSYSGAGGAGTQCVVKDHALVEVTYTYSYAGSGTVNETVLVAELHADEDPQTARFVAEVLGDAAVTAEEQRR